MSLFDGQPDEPMLSTKGPHPARGVAPLAERMRPRSLEEYVGQEHLLGPGKPLRVQLLAVRCIYGLLKDYIVYFTDCK